MSLRVSSTRSTGFHINRAKSMFKYQSTISLEGIGLASTIALQAANRLIDFGYCSLNKLETGAIKNGKTMNSKLTIVLDKAADFDARVKEFDEKVSGN
jgi:hypothetical protein